MPEFGNNLLALVDLNVWLALVYDGHVHHPVAISWFEHGGRDSAAFCRITFAISAQVRDALCLLNMPDLPAKEAREMRNILVHDYDGVNIGRVWDTAIEDIPVLQAAAEKYLKTLL
jgi:hypothetical protein